MDLTYDDEQRALAQAARALATREWTPQAVRDLEATGTGVAPELWKSVCALGWPGLVLPEEHGGSGGRISHLIAVLDELGAGAMSTPLPYSVALAALPVAWAAPSAGRDALLPHLVEGSSLAVCALLEADAHSRWPAEPAPGDATTGWHLTGTKTFVPYAGAADVLLVVTALAGLGRALVLVPVRAEGVHLRRLDAFAGEPLHELRLDSVAVGAADVVASGADAEALLERASDVFAVLLCAQATGLCEGALRVATQHARDRVQFGRPIGAFQAVANRLVDARAAIDGCRLLVHRAAFALDCGSDAAGDTPGERALHLATVSAATASMTRTVVAHTHQTLGALGLTLEHDLQLFTRRAKAIEILLGRRAHHLEAVASALGLEPISETRRH